MIAGLLASGSVSAAAFEFSPFTSMLLGDESYPGAVAIGDMNGDRLSDVVLIRAKAGVRMISVFSQQSDGTLIESKNYAIPNTNTFGDMVLADLNDDGALDMVTGYLDLHVLLSDGAGSHTLSDHHLAYGCSSSLQTVDLDRDGAIDLFCQDSDRAYFLLNDGHGAFDSTRIEIPSDSYYTDGQVGDVSGDGLADVVFAHGRDLILNINRGDGTFLPPSTFNTPYVLAGVTSGDFYPNGHDEVVAVGFESNPLMVFRQDGQGSLLPDYQRIEPPRRSTTALARDLNGDGKTDLLVTNDQENVVGYYIQRADGLPSVAQIAQIPLNFDPPLVAIATGDIDGDGCIDLATTQRIRMGMLNIARGMNCSHHRTVGDYNGDSVADLLWHNSATGAGSIWMSANYATQRSLTRVTNTNWRIVASGDFDGDAMADIVWHNRTTGAGAIWKSGRATTQQSLTRVTDLNWQIVSAGDYDGDGRDDLLWRHARNGKNAIWRSGNFATQQAMTAVTDVRWQVVGSGDFDADGSDDVLWRHSTKGGNAIWKGGDYRNQPPVTAVTNIDWKIGAIGDFDGDGSDDLFWRHANGGNTIWRSAAYAQQIAVPKQPIPWILAAAADYDGNGQDDVAWRNTVDGSNLIWGSANAAAVRNLTTVPSQNWKIH